MAKRPDLMVMSGTLSGRRFSVPDAGLRLGRASANDVHIPDEELSRSHCLFEADGVEGLRVLDLASANGTFVNGEAVGADPRKLRLGDEIVVGATTLKVVGEEAPVSAGGAVDLGLSAPVTSSVDGASKGGASARSPLAGILWAVAVLASAIAIALVLMMPTSKREAPVATPADAKHPQLTSLTYEKVEADATRIFRYSMTIDSGGVLRVVYDDVPEADRHVDKKTKLDERAKNRIRNILETRGWNELEDSYTGSSASDENALKSWRIRTVRNGRVREVLVENVPEPEPFKLVREALETFSRNELGIWAMQYSREQLVELSAESERVGDAKWEERDVEYGNLSASVDAYREAIFYLETVNPKPPHYGDLKKRLDRSVAELETRYKDQRFLADKAINLQDWETAQRELRVLCDLVPNKNDPRHDEANAKLVDVANRMTKSSKGGR